MTIESGRVPILLSSFFSFVGTFAAIVSRVAFEELLLAAVCKILLFEEEKITERRE